jgi:hypothetical protein
MQVKSQTVEMPEQQQQPVNAHPCRTPSSNQAGAPAVNGQEAIAAGLGQIRNRPMA